jgi:hypothetical protein
MTSGSLTLDPPTFRLSRLDETEGRWRSEPSAPRIVKISSQLLPVSATTPFIVASLGLSKATARRRATVSSWLVYLPSSWPDRRLSRI